MQLVVDGWQLTVDSYNRLKPIDKALKSLIFYEANRTVHDNISIPDFRDGFFYEQYSLKIRGLGFSLTFRVISGMVISLNTT
jgi:hypothetical protein